MRRSALFPLVLALALVGCGGSHHSSPATDTSVAGGATSLSAAIIGSGDDTTKNLKSAQKSFDGAYARNPSDPRAALGYGVSTVALDLQSLSDTLTKAQVAKGLNGLRNLTALDGLGRLGSSRRSVAAFLPALGIGLQSRASGLSGSQLQSIANDLRTVVNRLTSDRIEALEANPLVLSTGEDGLSVKLGTVEGYALRAAAEAAISGLDGTLAYDLESDDHSERLFETQFAGLIAAGTAIAPDDYLPSAPFGVLQSNGGTLLTELDADLGLGAADGSLALTRLASRTGSGYLTDLAPLTSDQKTMLQTQFSLAASVAAGPASVAASGSDVTVDLPGFIAHPPASLRDLYPSLQPATADGSVTLAPVTGSIADATLGGLVPAGVPSAVLYGRTLSIDDTTTQGEVAAGAFPLLFLAGA